MTGLATAPFPCAAARIFRAGDRVHADLPDGRYEGRVTAASPSGMSALVKLDRPAGRYPQGAQVPIPARLLERETA